MFEKALDQKDGLMIYHDLLVNKGLASPYHPRNWEIIEVVTQVLQVFKSATTALSGVYYPTSPLVLHKLYLMINKLGELEFRGSPYSDMVKPMKEKFVKYFKEIPPVLTCAATLNPCLNKMGVENLIHKISNELNLNDEDPHFSQGLIGRYNQNLNNLFDVYVTRYGQSSQVHESLRKAVNDTNNPDLALYNDLWAQSSSMARSDTPSSELGRYCGTNFIRTMTPADFLNLDVLAWWKGKEAQFPVLAAMARDLLTVQASTVASESAFSTSGRVISIRRTRLTPPSVEMSICLKDYLDAAERTQHQRSLEGEMDYEQELYELEVEENLTEEMTAAEAAFDDYLRNSSGSADES